MMKRSVGILLILCLMLSLVSCHGVRVDPDDRGQTSDSVFEVPEEFDTSREYEITFWAKNDTNITQADIYRKAIEDFQKLYPNIKVKLTLYTDYSRIYNDVITNISTNTTPNVCITYPDHIATYMTGADTVVPLDSLMANERYGLGGDELAFDGPSGEEIVEKFLSECRLDGRYYALPYMRSTEACYINKTFVEKLGYEIPEVLTWDFIWEVSEAALKKDSEGNFLVNGQKVLVPFIYKSTDNMMIQMLAQKGAGYSNEGGDILLFNSETGNMLLEIAEHSKSGAFDTFKRIGYPANFLNAGQCIFAVDSTAGATWMGSGAPNVDIPEENMIEFETVVRAVPQYNTDDPRMISQGPSMCIFNREDPQEVLASWLFAQYMLTNEVQIAYSQTEGYVPVTSKAQNSAEYTDYLSRRGEDGELYYDIKIDAVKLLIENTENTFVTPVFNGSASLRNGAGELIENVNKNVRRGEEVDSDYIDELYGEVTSLYRLDQIKRGKIDFDRMPLGTWVLGGALVLCWSGMAFYVIFNKIKGKKRQKIS